MKSKEPIDEQIINMVYKLILGRQLEIKEDALLKKWLGSSAYYRALLDDVQNDPMLKNKLLEAYMNDKDEFWKIVVTYRAALP